MTKNNTNIDVLPTAGVQGWNVVYEDNTDEFTTRLQGALDVDTAENLGDTAVDDVSAATVSSPSTIPVSGTSDDANINTNFTEMKTQIDALIADNEDLRTQVNALLTALRRTSGCGVLDG